MPWGNIPNKNPGDPVTSEQWNQIRENFLAIPVGETDVDHRLGPTAAGGLAWYPHAGGQSAMGSGEASASVAGLSTGTWAVWGQAGDGPDSEVKHGFCLVTAGAIVQQSTLIIAMAVSSSLSSSEFAINSGTLTFTGLGDTHILAIRIA